MYRILFEHNPKEGQEEEYIKQWQKGSDVIQRSPGALGTKLFRDPNKPGWLYAMADWESKQARDAAIKAIKDTSPDAEMVLHGHEVYLNSHEIIGQFELIAESKHLIEI